MEKQTTRLVNKILKKYKIISYPVNIEKIVQGENIQLQYREFEDEKWSGMLYKIGKTNIIAVNKSHSYARKRFTIGHELGHFFLSKNDSSIFVDTVIARFRNIDTDFDEIIANHFAAELLMPEHMLKHDIDEYMEDLDVAIPKLSELYQVSQQAITIRLISLGYIQL